MSSGLNLYCSEGGSWVDVRGLVYVLGTGGYNRLLKLLGKSGYEIHRSRSSTWVVGKKPCNELIKEINELVEKIMSEEETKAETGSSKCNPRGEPQITRFCASYSPVSLWATCTVYSPHAFACLTKINRDFHGYF